MKPLTGFDARQPEAYADTIDHVRIVQKQSFNLWWKG